MTDYNPDILECPFCDEIICDNKNEIWNHCDHLFSVQDDEVEWDIQEYKYINEICGICNEYAGCEKFENEIENMLRNLKIKNDLDVSSTICSPDIGIAECIESLSSEALLISQSWDADRPGGSGTFIYFFIRDIKKIKWIFDEFKIFHKRLIDFDKKNDEVYYKDE